MSGTIWRNLFYGIAVILIAIFIFLLIADKNGQFLALVAALISLVAARFDDLVKFKLSKDGLEGEMRQVIAEAKATVTQLHLLAEEQSKFFLWSMQANGRWDGTGPSAKNEMRERVVSMLKALGLNNTKISDVVSIEHPYVAFDYAQLVTQDLGNHLTEEQRNEWDAFFSSDKRKGIGYEPSPDELEAFLGSLGLVSDEVKERLADYRHFTATHKHRRPDIWNKAE